MDEPTNGSGTGLTVKEMVLRLEGKVDTLLKCTAEHENIHTQEAIKVAAASSNPETTPAGKALSDRIHTNELLVEAHERSIQRAFGAIGFIGFVGVSVVAILALRIFGIVS